MKRIICLVLVLVMFCGNVSYASFLSSPIFDFIMAGVLFSVAKNTNDNLSSIYSKIEDYQEQYNANSNTINTNMKQSYQYVEQADYYYCLGITALGQAINYAYNEGFYQGVDEFLYQYSKTKKEYYINSAAGCFSTGDTFMNKYDTLQKETTTLMTINGDLHNNIITQSSLVRQEFNNCVAPYMYASAFFVIKGLVDVTKMEDKIKVQANKEGVYIARVFKF